MNFGNRMNPLLNNNQLGNCNQINNINSFNPMENLNFMNNMNNFNNNMNNCSNDMNNFNDNMNHFNNDMNNFNNYVNSANNNNQINDINNFCNMNTNYIYNISRYSSFIKNIEQKCLCEINILKESFPDKKQGFFCTISYESKKIKVLITEFQEALQNVNTIIIYLFCPDHSIELDLGNNRRKYLSRNYGLSIIEIKNTDNINNFFEFDQEFFNKKYYNIQEKSRPYYIYFDIYFGIFEYNNNNDHKIIINDASSHCFCFFSPLLNEQNKVIGIIDCRDCKPRILLKKPIDEFLLQYKQYSNSQFNKANHIFDNNNRIITNNNLNSFLHRNEIRMKIKIEYNQILEKILLLNNLTNDLNLIEKGIEKLEENDIMIFIENIETKYLHYFRPTKAGIYDIKIKFKKNLKNCCYMFSDNQMIIEINLSCFDTRNVTNMRGMFNNASNIKNIYFSPFFNTKNVTTMEEMFAGCGNLENLDLSSFNTTNVTNMRSIFDGCRNLKYLDISSFDTRNVRNMESMFKGCNNLEILDLLSFDTSNVRNMESMFKGCNKLEILDLLSFDTRNVTTMEKMFAECRTLKNLNLASFNTKKVNNMKSMFDCCGLEKLDLSNFDTRNVENMEALFRENYGLKNIIFSPSFITNKVISMNHMFSYTPLINLDLSSFEINNICETMNMFGGCGVKVVKIKNNKNIYKILKSQTKAKIIII